MQEMNESIIKNDSRAFQGNLHFVWRKQNTHTHNIFLPNMPNRRRLIWIIINEILFEANADDIGCDILYGNLKWDEIRGNTKYYLKRENQSIIHFLSVWRVTCLVDRWKKNGLGR